MNASPRQGVWNPSRHDSGARGDWQLSWQGLPVFEAVCKPGPQCWRSSCTRPNKRASAALLSYYGMHIQPRRYLMSALPVTRVVLYKHGVGYFERHGSVEGDATL